LLEALTLMPKSERKKIVLEVHGANLEHQSLEFQQKIEELRAPLIKQGVVQWVGPYQPHELRSRMSGIDWVIVPSIWWENSPMVIQEAKVCGRPLLVSNIGGMAEKIDHNINGISVSAGNRIEWRNVFARNDITPLFDNFLANIVKPLSYTQCAEQHLKLL